MATELAAPTPQAYEGARCLEHPDLEAVGTCSRCGRFVCAVDQRTVGPRQFCEQCAARPEVDYLEVLSRVGDADASALGEAVGAGTIVPLGLGLILWFDGRNRLFFKIDIPPTSSRSCGTCT